MIKTLVICAFGISILGAGTTTPTVKDLKPESIGFTAGPIEFRACLDGVSTSSSEISEFAFTVYSQSGQILKVKF